MEDVPARTERLNALLGGGAEARSSAYELLAKVCCNGDKAGSDAYEADVAVAAAVMPAFANVLARDVQDVGAEEFRRAAYLLMTLQLLDLRITAGYIRVWNAVSLAPSNAAVVCLDMPVDELEREDLLTLSAMHVSIGVSFAKGFTKACAAVEDPPAELEGIQAYINAPVTATTSHSRGKTSDEYNLALARRALALLQAGPDLPNPAASGLWSLIWMCSSNRSSIGERMFQEVLPVAMEALSRGSASEWLNVSRCDHFLYNAVFGAVKDAAEAAFTVGVDVIPLLLSSGYLAACVKMLEAYKAEKGPSPDTNIMSIFYGVLWNLASIDFSNSPEALVVLRGAAGALRYAMDHGVPQLQDLGLTTDVFAAILAANLFGKDEGDGELKLGPADIKQILGYFAEMTTGTSWGGMFPLPTGFVMLNLAVSDAHKLLLLENDEFIPHCIDGLMLDMEVRKDTETVARATTQRNYAELFQQVALFQPGRKALLAAGKPVQLALEAVVAASIWIDPQDEERTIIEAAKTSAGNTLSLLNPQAKDGKQAQEIGPKTPHLMMSCASTHERCLVTWD